MEIASSELGRLFSEDLDLLMQLWGEDAELTEMCTDFLNLSEMAPGDAQLAQQISETLSGLEAEIRRHLQQVKETRLHQR